MNFFLKRLSYLFFHAYAYFYVELFKYDNVTYSQIKEDQILDILTGGKGEGVYIDIGANHPDIISNTKKFYERGWHGVNIEPDNRGYELFKKQRIRDINIHSAVGEGVADYFEMQNSVGSTFSKKVFNERDYKSQKHEVRKMELIPLRKVFQDNGLTTVDFISIDVEGFEKEVLASNDWERYWAKVLCIEGKGYGPFLKRFGYHIVLFDGSNSYYVRR